MDIVKRSVLKSTDVTNMHLSDTQTSLELFEWRPNDTRTSLTAELGRSNIANDGGRVGAMPGAD